MLPAIGYGDRTINNMKTVVIRNSCLWGLAILTVTFLLLSGNPVAAQGTQPIRNQFTTNQSVNVPSDRFVPVWNSSVKKWNNEDLDIRHDGTNDVFNTRTVFNGAVSNSVGGFWSTDVSSFVSYSSASDYMIFSHPQGGIVSTLDNWLVQFNVTPVFSFGSAVSEAKTNFNTVATNSAKAFLLTGGQTASMAAVVDANTNVTSSSTISTTELGYLDGLTSALSISLSNNVRVAAGTGGITVTPSGAGGVMTYTVSDDNAGSGTNFSGAIITNAIERTVWRAGSVTNLTVPWGVTNRIVWHPASNAGLQMSGTPGQGTNEQIIHLMVCLTNSGITSVVMPTNEISGLSPFFLTAPSTNEFDLVYNGDKFYIVSYQTPTTGSGQTVVVSTNPVVYTPTIRQVPTVVAGTGGANTNFTLISTQPEVSVNGFTNVSIRAVMGYDSGLVDYWTCVITNGSGSARTLEFSAVTNNWRFNGVYGTNAPNTLTNATRLEISGRQHGTNVQVLYSYTPWP